MSMSQDSYDTECGDLAATLNGRATKRIDWTSLEADVTPAEERSGLGAPDGAEGHAGHDRMSLQLNAPHMYVARDDGLRHLQQPGTRMAFSSPADTTTVSPPVSTHGSRAFKQQTAPDMVVRQLGAAAAPGDRTPFTFAGLALLLGYAWLLAGVDKILLGTFPAQLTTILTGTLQGGRIPGFFATMLRMLVLPSGTLFGVLAEYAETLAGLGLIVAGLAILIAPPLERRVAPPLARLIARVRRLLVTLGVLAAIGTIFLGATYYLLDGAPLQGFMPSVAFNGALDPGLELALGGTLLLIAAVLGRVRRRQRS